MMRGIIKGATDAGLTPRQIGDALLRVDPAYADKWGEIVGVKEGSRLFNEVGPTLQETVSVSGILDTPSRL